MNSVCIHVNMKLGSRQSIKASLVVITMLMFLPPMYTKHIANVYLTFLSTYVCTYILGRCLLFLQYVWLLVSNISMTLTFLRQYIFSMTSSFCIVYVDIYVFINIHICMEKIIYKYVCIYFTLTLVITITTL